MSESCITPLFEPPIRVLATVAFIGKFGETDGAINTYHRLGPYFQSLGASVDLVAYGPEDGLETIYPGVRLFCHKVRVPLPLDAERNVDPLVSFSPTARLIAKEPYQIVQTSSPDPIGLLAVATSRRLNIPMISIYHTALDEYTRIRVTRDWGEPIGNLAGGLMHNWLNWYSSQASLVLAPSQAVAEQLRSRITTPVEVLSRGIDADQFHPRHRNRSDERVRLIYVGRVTPEKNLRLLADLFGSRTDIDLVIAGKGIFEAELRAMMPHASFVGQLSGQELLTMYASGDIFVFPSKTDTLGNVVLEAMASGIPAVVFDALGPKELIDHGVTGFVAASDEQFARSVEQLIADGNLRRRMGAAARMSAESRSWYSIAHRLVSFYRQLVPNHPPGHREKPTAVAQVAP